MKKMAIVLAALFFAGFAMAEEVKCDEETHPCSGNLTLSLPHILNIKKEYNLLTAEQKVAEAQNYALRSKYTGVNFGVYAQYRWKLFGMNNGLEGKPTSEVVAYYKEAKGLGNKNLKRSTVALLKAKDEKKQ